MEKVVFSFLVFWSARFEQPLGVSASFVVVGSLGSVLVVWEKCEVRLDKVR
jgi:hypothetical protein